MTDDVPEAHDVMRLVERIRPFFAGVDASVIGAVLADLTALYLAGHVAENPSKTEKLRKAAFDVHVKAIKALIPLNEAMIKDRLEAGKNATTRTN